MATKKDKKPAPVAKSTAKRKPESVAKTAPPPPPPQKVRLTVDGKEIEVPAGTSLMQACEEAGAEIPRFCYHERLSVAGNCRMCLVEVEKQPKLAASCAVGAMEGMVVSTTSPKTIEARKGVMEFLLINHPLDCPICDQGGECDLQDQAMAYGAGGSRFADNKRAVEEKSFGPLIKTEMTRCIHCTRCVRFAEEVAGMPELGAIGRGEDMEITTYLRESVRSELSGNVVDLCPVGALTSRPYAFRARSWELRETHALDVMDAAASHIRADARGREVMRILPRRCDDINEDWISDKIRFSVDGLKLQRLDRPYLREGGRLVESSWDKVFSRIARAAKIAGGKGSAAIAGDLACAESMKALKDLMDMVGSPHLDCRQDGAAIPLEHGRGGWLFNSGFDAIEEADAILLIGAWPKLEAPVIEARLRKAWLHNGTSIAAIGEGGRHNYGVENLGAGIEVLAELAAGKHGFAKTLSAAKRPMVILGMGALTGAAGKEAYTLALALAHQCGAIGKTWNGFNLFHNAAARTGGLDLGFVPQEKGMDTRQICTAASSGKLGLLFLLHADEFSGLARHENTCIIYQGSHGDKGAALADIVLPGAAWTEKNALWVNMEGRVQESMRAIFPPGDAREDWTIIRALSDYLGNALPYDDLPALRVAIVEDAPHFGQISERSPAAAPPNPKSLPRVSKPHAFTPPFADFYLTNPIARASKTMAACSRAQTSETQTGESDA